MPRIFNGEQTVSLKSRAGKTGYQHIKEKNKIPILHHLQKLTGNHDTLEENIEEKPLDTALGNDVLNKTPKVQATK